MKLPLGLTLILFVLLSCSNKSWRESSRESIGLATPAREQEEDIFQIYYARAFSWKGFFGVHPWVAWKKSEEDSYTVAQVTSWNVRRSGRAISVAQDLPDRKWFNRRPVIMFEVTGDKARTIIDKVKKEIKRYPFNDKYRVWPGPNSNTFVAYLINNIEELNLELPPHAIGKDYALIRDIGGITPSGTGFQVSLFGLLGVEMGLYEGIEFNLFGLHFGLDFYTPALKLPFIGRVGMKDKPKE